MTDAQRRALAMGRKIGASAGGKAVARKPVPEDCDHCKMMGYTRWHQHIGHLGARALLEKHPTAISYVWGKIRARRQK